MHQARKSRIWQIQDLLMNAAIDEMPADDGIAEPGMILTVRFDGTGETETFLLGTPIAELGDLEVCSAQSPLGDAISGARDRKSTRLNSRPNAHLVCRIL